MCALFRDVPKCTIRVLTWKLTSERTQEKSHTFVIGRTVVDNLPAQTNLHATKERIREKRNMAALSVDGSSCVAIIFLNMPRDTWPASEPLCGNSRSKNWNKCRCNKLRDCSWPLWPFPLSPVIFCRHSNHFVLLHHILFSCDPFVSHHHLSTSVCQLIHSWIFYPLHNDHVSALTFP